MLLPQRRMGLQAFQTLEERKTLLPPEVVEEAGVTLSGREVGDGVNVFLEAVPVNTENGKRKVGAVVSSLDNDSAFGHGDSFLFESSYREV
jgi:hypothetical protein